jgi:cyclopropane-fatty-acyl-phospholipid synthase
MHPLLQRVFDWFVQKGNIRVKTSSGATFTLGDGSGTLIAVRFTSLAAELGVLIDPELKFGEAYMDGTLVVEEGTIADVVALAFAQDGAGKVPHWGRPQSLVRELSRRLQRLNAKGRTRSKVPHHYDLEGPFYSLFLDADRQYSCAYFETPDQSLEEAQLAKKRHIAAKLLVEPVSRVLDMGCGFGGLAFYLTEVCGANVTGVTLSEAQIAQAKARADERGLGGRTSFRAQDYRDVTGVFDRIVSVEMIENLGFGSSETFLRKCADLVADDGVILLHTSVRAEGPEISSPFVAKYLFPGGYIPALSELLSAIERAGLLVTDIEFLRGHCAETIKAWRERLLAHREEIERLYDARFVRMCDFCLVCSEMAFRAHGAVVVQLQMTKRQSVVPITRDYIAREEARLRGLEGRHRAPLGGGE